MASPFFCLYCGQEKQSCESSLEHAIPQFMGGDHAPKIFQLTNVCATCNNRLGLWVDAAYARSWFITNYLAEAARSLCTKPDDPGLPLRCMGPARIPNLFVPQDYVSEHWIGPSGETVIRVRPHDERMDGYTGGNPIETKKKPSVAYFFPVSDNPSQSKIGFRSFNRALEKRKARKILAATIRDANGSEVDPTIVGFDSPTIEETSSCDAIRAAIHGEGISVRPAVDPKFDQRFMCKLALGVGYSLFGESLLIQPAAVELRRGVWPSSDREKSAIRGVSTFSALDAPASQVAGYPGAIAICVTRISPLWMTSVTIDEKLPSAIELGTSAMESAHVDAEEGYVLPLLPYLDDFVVLTMAELIAHRIGAMRNAALEEIDAIRMAASQFNVHLTTTI